MDAIMPDKREFRPRPCVPSLPPMTAAAVLYVKELALTSKFYERCFGLSPGLSDL
jgi:hypothetical protein